MPGMSDVQQSRGWAAQYIEVTELAGVRSAVLTFRCRTSAVSFVLFPMIHLGEPAFYGQVADRLRRCDLVVAEGIRGGSVSAQAITAAYRRLDGSRRLGLVVQHIDFDALGVPVANPDMTDREFDGEFRKLPLRERMAMAALVPVFVAGMRLLGTRHWLARQLQTEDLPTDAEQAAADGFEGLEKLLVDSRDRLLLDTLTKIHQERSAAGERSVVGVVYGADHMRAVAEHLWALDYRPLDSEWLTVFHLHQPPGRTR